MRSNCKQKTYDRKNYKIIHDIKQYNNDENNYTPFNKIEKRNNNIICDNNIIYNNIYNNYYSYNKKTNNINNINYYKDINDYHKKFPELMELKMNAIFLILILGYKLLYQVKKL